MKQKIPGRNLIRHQETIISKVKVIAFTFYFLNYGTFLQQLECGYGFPALIHVWIASAGVLEWFSPFANSVYLIIIINKILLHNGNCPISDPITEIGVAHAVGLEVFQN